MVKGIIRTRLGLRRKRSDGAPFAPRSGKLMGMNTMADRSKFISQIGSSLTELVKSATKASTKTVACSAVKNSTASDEQDRLVHSRQQVTSLLTVRTTCLELLESGTEHVQALVRTLGPASLILASATCVRSALEPCALIMWLSDASADERERIGRVFAYRYAGQDQQRKFSRLAGPPVKEEHIRVNMKNIIANAAGRGYRILKNKKRMTVGIHKYMPSATKLISDYLREEEAYRLLSAVAHGHEWAIRSFAYQATSIVPNTVIDGVPATSFVKRRNSPSIIAYLSLLMATSFSKAVIAYGEYIGWDKRDLVGIRGAEYELLRVVSTLFGGVPIASTISMNH